MFAGERALRASLPDRSGENSMRLFIPSKCHVCDALFAEREEKLSREEDHKYARAVKCCTNPRHEFSSQHSDKNDLASEYACGETALFQ